MVLTEEQRKAILEQSAGMSVEEKQAFADKINNAKSLDEAKVNTVNNIEANKLTADVPVKPVEVKKVDYTKIETPINKITTETSINKPVNTAIDTPVKPVDNKPIEANKVDKNILPVDIAQWKAKGSDMNTLESMIEGKYGTVATNNNGVLTADINGERFQWKIDNAGNPIKTSLGPVDNINLAKNPDAMFNTMVAGGEISEDIKSTPEYTKVKTRFDKFNLYSNYTDGQLGLSLSNGSLLPGTQTYSDLMNDPIQKDRINKATQLNTLNGKNKVDTNKVFEEKSTEILDGTKVTVGGQTMTMKKALEDNYISQDEYNKLTNTPAITTKINEVDSLKVDYLKKKAVYDAIETEVEAELKGTGATSSMKAKMVANRRKDLLGDLNLSMSLYNNAVGTLTQLKADSTALFAQNYSLYQNEQAKIDANNKLQDTRAYNYAVLQEQRAYEQANNVKTSIIDRNGEQILINTQTGEEIKNLGTPGGTAKTSSDWTKLDDNTLYNKYTGETKSVSKEEANNYGTTTVTAGTSGNRSDRNNNPGNVKLAQGQSIDNIIGAVGQDDQGHLIFDTAENGYNHFIKDIEAKLNGGSRYLDKNSTLGDLAKVYAEDPNWGNAVSQMSGYSLDTKVSDININKLAPAIVKQEGFTGSITTTQPINNIKEYSNTATDWGQNILRGKAKLSDISGNPELKDEVSSYIANNTVKLTKNDPIIKGLKEDLTTANFLSDPKNESLAEDVSGGYKFSPWDSLTGEKQQYLRKAQFILDGQTLQNLIDIKAAGGTFGALSEKELAILQKSASLLNSAADRDELGKITGFTMSEVDFKKALSDLSTAYAKSIKNMTGISSGNTGNTESGNIITSASGNTYTY